MIIDVFRENKPMTRWDLLTKWLRPEIWKYGSLLKRLERQNTKSMVWTLKCSFFNNLARSAKIMKLHAYTLFWFTSLCFKSAKRLVSMRSMRNNDFGAIPHDLLKWHAVLFSSFIIVVHHFKLHLMQACMKCMRYMPLHRNLNQKTRWAISRVEMIDIPVFHFRLHFPMMLKPGFLGCKAQRRNASLREAFELSLPKASAYVCTDPQIADRPGSAGPPSTSVRAPNYGKRSFAPRKREEHLPIWTKPYKPNLKLKIITIINLRKPI